MPLDNIWRAIVEMIRWVFGLLHRKGCCPSCKGTGSSYDVETGGRCWDCFGTGHCHIMNRWQT
jgi:hypothetical protein